jgi:DNA replication protein DnaC
VRATFLTVGHLDYHETVCHTGDSRNRPAVLLLDELGYLPIDKRGADLLFQVVAARFEVGSIVITTNRPFREWGKLFDVDNTLATALIDRLMHHGEGIVIQGDSYRMKDKDPDSTDE